MIFHTCHSVSCLSSMDFFSLSLQSFLSHTSAAETHGFKVQVTRHPEFLSGCLYFPENQPNSVQRCGVWPRARLSFLSAAQSSKLEPSQISKRSRRSPGRILLFFVGLKWQCQVDLPEQMGLAVRVTWSTNTKLLKAST